MKRREFLKGLGVVVPALVLAPSLLKGETHKYEQGEHYESMEWTEDDGPWHPDGTRCTCEPWLEKKRSGHGVMTRAQFQKDMQQSLNKVFDDIYKTNWHRRVKEIWDA